MVQTVYISEQREGAVLDFTGVNSMVGVNSCKSTNYPKDELSNK